MALDISSGAVDPYKNKQNYDNWNKHLKGLTSQNEAAIVLYLENMRRGVNIAPNAAKGKRGYSGLRAQKHRLKRIAELLQKHYSISDVACEKDAEVKKLKDALADLFERMESGEVKKSDGKRYTSVSDYIKGFKAFWHWHMTYKHNEEGKSLPDILEYVTTKRKEKPKFVFLSDGVKKAPGEGLKRLINNAKPFYKVLVAFLFDSGIRVTELVNVRLKDVTFVDADRYVLLNIREETAKTFGRQIKLLLCYDLLKDYVAEQKFAPEGFLFPIKTYMTNRYIKRLAKRVLGKDNVTMYDFRHNSACYWLQRYKTEAELMYRLGWKESNMIHYYTEYMGLKDTIKTEDLMVDVTKTDLQKQLDRERQQRQLMQEQLAAVQAQVMKMVVANVRQRLVAGKA